MAHRATCGRVLVSRSNRCHSGIARRRLAMEFLESRQLLSVDSLISSIDSVRLDLNPHYFADGYRVGLDLAEQEFAIKINSPDADKALAQLITLGGPLEGFQVETELTKNIYLITGRDLAPAGLLDQDVAWITPTYMSEVTGDKVLVLDEVVVAIEPGVNPKDVLGTDAMHYRPLLGTHDQFVVTLGEGGQAALDYANNLMKNEQVVWATPNLYQNMHKMFTPNDTLFSTQWHLNNTGAQVPDAIIGADIEAVAAWNISTGMGVTIAILDDGIERTHPDLAGNIFVNPGEIASNGIDDDGNGWIDDVSGWSFVTNSPNPSVSVYDTHGTSVAGVAAAAGNNGLGVSGSAFNATILPVQIFDGDYYVSDAASASAIYYAAGRTADGMGNWNAAQVLNCSWGGGSSSTTLTEAFTWASNIARDGKGVTTFISSGNDYYDSVSYPASLSSTLSGVMAVGASNQRDLRSEYTNYGTALDFLAPSSDIDSPYTVGITTTDRTGSFGYNSGDYTDNTVSYGFGGTSSASPLAAGVGALLLSADPSLTAAQVKQILRGTADKVGGVVYDANGFNLEYGYGRINAFAALQQLGLSVIGTLPANGAVVNSPPTPIGRYQVDFSHPYSPNSDDIVAGGFQINGVSANSTTIIDDNTLQFNFDVNPVVAQGVHSLTLDSGTVKRLSDGDPLRAYSGMFYYDILPLAVSDTLPVVDSLITLPLNALDVHFNETIQASSVQASDFVLNQGSVTDAVPLDGETVRLTLSGLVSEGTLTLSIAAGALTDIYDNPNVPFNGSYELDVGIVSYPVPLLAKPPLGSLVYDSEFLGTIHSAGETDTFTIDLDSGQTISVVATASERTLRPFVEIYSPSNVLLGREEAGGAGQSALLNMLPANMAGTYRLVIGGAGGTIGGYSNRLILNAALEREGLIDDVSNNTLATAQEINSSLINLVQTASRGAVLGGVLAGNIEGFETGDFSGLPWVTSGDAVWYVTNEEAADGIYCARAGDISDSQSSTLSVVQTTEAGKVSFAHRVSSEYGYDYLLFSIDGVQMGAWSGIESTFTTESYPVTSGTHTFTWSYTKDYVHSDGLDTAFIDNVVFLPSDIDVYSFSLDQGETATIVLEAMVGAAEGFQIRDIANHLLATSVAVPSNVDQAISHFTASAAGTNTYYVVVTTSTAYNLVVTRNATFELEANNSYTEALDVSGFHCILGHLEPESGTLTEGFEAGNFSGLPWITSGDAAWYVTHEAAANGTYSARAGDIYDYQSSTLSIVQTTTAGNMSFARRVSSEGGYDGLLFFIDGELVGYWSGIENTFTTESFPVMAGTHTFTWSYTKDSSYSDGLDTAFIDEVVFPMVVVPQDWYQISVDAGDYLELQTSTPGGADGEFVNALNPQIELYGPDGGLITSDANSADDGRNARITYVATQTGFYRVRVTAEDDTFGEYGMMIDRSPLALTVPSEINEIDGATEGMIETSGPLSKDLVVILVSSAPDRITVPASVMIPAGETSTPVPMTITNDSLLQGPEAVTITAFVEGVGYGARVGRIEVHDDETAVLFITLPASATEGDGVGVGVGTILSTAAPIRDVLIQLTSSDTSEVAVPASIVLPADQTSVAFNMTIIDDTIIDGVQIATVTAHVENWIDIPASMAVFDNDRALVVTLPTVAWEGEGTLAGSGKVAIGGPMPIDLVVTLDSDDTSALEVPATVTILAGQTSATFDVTIVDDLDHDGAQAAVVTARVPSFDGASATCVIHDNELDRLEWDTIASPQTAGVAFVATVRAKNVDDETIEVYEETMPLGAVGDSGALPVTPGDCVFVAGIWNGDITINAVDSDVILTVDDGAGHMANSNIFDVTYGPLDHFQWSTIDSPKYVNGLIPVTLMALDANGYTVTDFNETVDLSGWVGTSVGIVEVLSFIGYADTSSTGEYQNTLAAISAYFNDYHESSTTVTTAEELQTALEGKDVFLVPEQENASFTILNSLANDWSRVLNSFVSKGGTVIVCSHYQDEHLILNNAGLMTLSAVYDVETDSLTKVVDTVLNAGVSVPFTGYWIHRYSTTTDGQVSLQSVNGGYPVVLSRDIGDGHVVMIGTDYFDLYTGMDRIIANAVEWAQGSSIPVSISPIVTGHFLNGVWMGSVAVFEEAVDMHLRANYGDFTADSNTFDVVPLTMNLDIPTDAAEDGGSVVGTVKIPACMSTDLVVDLMSGNPSRVSVPGSVTILAGQTSATFDVQVVDNAFLDGMEEVTITAKAMDTITDDAILAVHDDETAFLFIALPASATEGDGVGVGTVISTGEPTRDIVIHLTSSHTSEVTVPATVVLPAGQSSVAFDVTIVDDTIIDGVQIATITATVENWINGTANMAVFDNDRTLAISLLTDAWEGEGTLAGSGMVTIGGTLSIDLVVTLHSDDTSELEVPATVTILAGQTTATFDATIVDDLDHDGAQAATVTARMPTFEDATAACVIHDNELNLLEWETIVSPQMAGVAFAATIRAKNVDDETIGVYDEMVPLRAVGLRGDLPVTPGGCLFVAGIWNGDITINAVDSNVILTVDDGAGHLANSNAFDVSFGPLDHFQWSTINSPQYQNIPFEVTVTALDAHGYRVTDFDDTVELGGWISAVEQVTVGTGTSYWTHPMSTNYHDGRTQVIYWQSEIGSACEITGLALDVTAFPAQTINEWTIRMKHTPLNSYSTAALESTGWTIVYHNDETVSSTGWINFVFSTPFDYNGTDNLMIDFSHNNSYNTNAGTCRYTPSASIRVAFARSNSAYGDPLDWSGTSSPSVYGEKLVPNLRLTTSTWGMVSIMPQVTGTFVDGIWTGDVTVFEEIAGIYLRANDGSGYAADSNTFEVIADTIAPMVTDVLVKGNTWDDDFLDYLDAEDLGHPDLPRLGYHLTSGEDQLDALPWGNLDQITIVFSENVVVAENDIGLYGRNMQIHDVVGFRYDVANHAATWTFHEPLGTDLLLIALTDAVRDVAGNALDGEWVNSTSVFPSGNGAPGGSFNFLFNVLPGDFNYSGMVDGEDLGIWENGIGTMGGAYLDDGDADGDGDVDGNDFLTWQQNFGSSTPSGSSTTNSTGSSSTEAIGGIPRRKINESSALSSNSAYDLVDLVRSSIGNGQNISALSAVGRSISFKFIDFANWSLQQPMPKINSDSFPWLDPKFQLHHGIQPLQYNQAIDAVMSSLDEQFTETMVGRAHRKTSENIIPITMTAALDNPWMLGFANETSLRQVACRSFSKFRRPED